MPFLCSSHCVNVLTFWKFWKFSTFSVVFCFFLEITSGILISAASQISFAYYNDEVSVGIWVSHFTGKVMSLIVSAIPKWTGFYMIGTSVMKELWMLHSTSLPLSVTRNLWIRWFFFMLRLCIVTVS